MMEAVKVSFKSEGLTISAVLHLPDKARAPFVVASHGLLSNKDSDKYVALGERLSEEGIALLRFDFRGCGESEGTLAESTLTGRIDDLGAAIEFARSYRGLGKRMGLLGSSLGGYISLVKSALNPEVRAVVTWATPFHLDGIESQKDAAGMPILGEPFFADLPNHRLLPLLSKVTNCLVIHGQADELVPVDQAWEIFNSLGTYKEIRILEGADHRLTNPDHRQRATDLTVAWFKKFV
jgi:fermentation-respiration switch protein FrsA (DUF1100 family)